MSQTKTTTTKTTTDKFADRINFTLLGKKIGMTQVFAPTGEVVPVTVVEVGPCVILQKKTLEKEGYSAIQLGFDDKRPQNVTKPEAGHAKAAKSKVKRFRKEVRLDPATLADLEVGQVLTADLLKVGDAVDITGTSIGKGFQGVMKRHNFRGARHSHNHEFFRHGGSIGMRSIPGRVFKNKKMPGQMGNVEVTTPNLKVAGVDGSKNIVLIRGAVPGAKNGYVTLKASLKGGFEKRSWKPAPKAEVEAPVAAAEETKTE